MLTQLDINKRLNDGYYKNELDYPSARSFKSKCGKMVSTMTSYEFCPKCGEELAPILKDYEKIMNAYDQEENRIKNEFIKDAFEALEITNNPKREKLYSVAWDQGHSAGLHSVWSYMQELMELIK